MLISMKNLALTAFALAVPLGLAGSQRAAAQNAILAEMYGRGVHAYNAGNYTDAQQYLSMAIDNGIQDPRAYYFRGMVAHASGNPYLAETDWQVGAELEAAGQVNASIGRSLARFQGAARIELEGIRQQAKLQALAQAMSRSKQRYGELGVEPAGAAAAPPRVAAPPAAAPVAPAAPPAAADDPFADNLAEGQPNVVADDALQGAMEDPFADQGGPAAAPPADASPFGEGTAPADDPFGGAGADPFGGGEAGGAMEDPFGGTDGGADSGAGEDPFGN
jgi:hypothetical protein